VAVVQQLSESAAVAELADATAFALSALADLITTVVWTVTVPSSPHLAGKLMARKSRLAIAKE
jgi:hypothetical protein